MTSSQQMLLGANSGPSLDGLAVSYYTSGAFIFTMSVTGDSAGNIYGGCYQDNGGNNPADIKSYLVKFTSAGAIGWQKVMTYPGTGAYQIRQYAKSTVLDSSGNIYSAFWMDQNANPYPRVSFIVKFNSAGTLLWQKSFGHSTNNSFALYSLALNSAGTILYAGGTSQGDFTYLLSISASTGDINWQNCNYTQGPWESLAVDSGGNIICGASWYNASYNQNVIAKFNSSGTLQWSNYWRDNNGNLTFTGVGVDSSDNYYLSCTNYSYGGFILKVNSSGTVVWQKGTNGTEQGSPGFINVTASGDLYGWSQNTSNSYGVAKWNSAGTFSWLNKLTAVVPSNLTAGSAGLGTTDYFLTTARGVVSGTYVGGVFYRFPRDGSKNASNTVNPAPFNIAYSAGVGPSNYDISSFTYASHSTSNETPRIVDAGKTLTIADATVSSNAVIW